MTRNTTTRIVELFVLLLWCVTVTNARVAVNNVKRCNSGWMMCRGGASWRDFFGIAGVDEKDAVVTSYNRGGGGGGHNDTASDDSSSRNKSNDDGDDKHKKINPDDEDQVVGVKEHKKSNAVGDPDGSDSDSDDDDDSEFDESDWEHFEQEMLDASTPQVQVEVELVEEQQPQQEPSIVPTISTSAVRPGGGVGLRLGQRLQNQHRRLQQKSKSRQVVQQTQLLQAWEEFVYAPLLPALETAEARLLDGASKVRLDRRTLYAGLALEWKKGSSERRFLSPTTSQALQAALSLATQPAWRQSIPRPSAIRLWDDESRACTMAMQETVAMALVSSLCVSAAGVLLL